MGIKRNSKGELAEVNPLRTRKGSVYIRGINEKFKISRSKFSSFLDCKRCFYLDRVKGLKDPGMPGWSLNVAVDELLKKEFDLLRSQKKPHPIFKKHNVGCYNWGLVAGKSQTHFGWETIMNLHDLKQKGEFIEDEEDIPEPEIWFHDIYRKNGSAFDEEEVNFIKKILS